MSDSHPGASVDTLRNAADGVLLDAVIAGDAPSFHHCRELTDSFGMAQFARLAEPDLNFGYCVDDNARALLTSILALHLKEDFRDAQIVGETTLHFLEFCQLPDGRFHNLVGADRSFLDDVGSPDSFGRTVWALGVTVRCAPLEEWRTAAERMLESCLPHVGELVPIRPRAYAVLGLSALVDPMKAALVAPLAGPLPGHLNDQAQSLLLQLAENLTRELAVHASPDWNWWEDMLSWGNARLPEALLRAALATGHSAFRQAGMSALEFLGNVTQPQAMFEPVGNYGWFKRGGEPAKYDQQPIEACAMVDMWLAAEQLTGEDRYHRKALEAFAWFVGLNSENLMVADPKIGGCHDGLKRGSLNQNMGAESTLSYVHAHAAVGTASKKKQL